MALSINPKSLPRYQTLGMLGIVLILVVCIVGFFMARGFFDEERRIALLEQRIVANQQQRLRNELAAVQDFIRYMGERAEQVLIDDARSQVDQAFQVAESLYNQHRDSLPEAELKALIRETLRDVRFFGGRGYLFIDDMAGNCILLPTAPHLEGSSLYDNRDDTGRYIMRSLINSVSGPTGEGYTRYRWYMPGNDQQMADKIAYVRHFAPYDWIIGTGDYIYRFEEDLKQQALARIAALRFGNQGYVAVLKTDGTVLFNPRHGNGINPLPKEQMMGPERQVVEKILQVAGSGGGFVEYDWFYPGSYRLGKKISLVEVVPEWGWILVAGIYTDDVRAIIATQTLDLEQSLSRDTELLIAAIALTILVTLGLAFFYNRWLRKLFDQYQRDNDRQKAALASNARDLRIAARVFDTAREGILVTDPNNQIVAVNAAFSEITGYTQREVMGRDPAFLSSGKHQPTFYRDMWQSLQLNDYWSGEVWNRRKSGALFPEHISISVARDERGEVVNYVATLTDITEQKHTEEKLRYLAEYDSLSGLPNRYLLTERVNQLIRSQQPQSCFALMFVDIDRFKNINDSLGHTVGDTVLQAVSRRLSSIVHDEDTVSRIGGDEFVLLLTGLSSDELQRAEQLIQRAERLLQRVAEPIRERDLDLVVTPSIGIACYPQHGDHFDTLLSNADAALYHAKAQGRNNYQFYSVELNEQASQRLVMETALRGALENEALELYYQPQYQLSDGQLVGAEALLRWHHPEFGMVPPDQFIPLAEETGLIVPIGDWVLEQGCRQGASWLARGFNIQALAINVSAVQFRSDFVERVDRVLQQTGFPAEKLVLEVTESALMDDTGRAEKLLRKLKALGVQLALDDFGTGYSSLAYLKRFSLDVLKIDRAFIRGLPSDKDDVALTSSILDIARNLELSVVAEGVEDAEQQAFLSQAGCDKVQGYFYARPLPQAEFAAKLAAAVEQV